MSTVLLTGANRGLGIEFVRQYAAKGWGIIACYRSLSDELSKLATQHSGIRLQQLDVADHAAIEKLADELAGVPIDVLLNNAGIYGSRSFAEGGIEHQAFGHTDFENWENVMRVNLFGPMKMAESFVEHVLASQQKKIVTISSMVGSMGLNSQGGMYAYRTSKAAVNMQMHSMGIDLLKRGILAAAIHPGWAKTDMGGQGADIEPEEGVAGVIERIAELNESMLGQLNAFDGSVLPY